MRAFRGSVTATQMDDIWNEDSFSVSPLRYSSSHEIMHFYNLMEIVTCLSEVDDNYECATFQLVNRWSTFSKVQLNIAYQNLCAAIKRLSIVQLIFDAPFWLNWRAKWRTSFHSSCWPTNTSSIQNECGVRLE